MRRWLSALLAAFLLGLVVSPSDGPDLMAEGCVVRLLSTGPVLLNDANHHCSPRFTSATVDAQGQLIISYPEVSQVVTCVVEEDETLVDRNVMAGASVGKTYTVVKFATAGTVVSALSSTVTGSSSNIFLLCLSVPLAE